MTSVALVYPKHSCHFIPNVARLLENDFEVRHFPYDTNDTIDFGTPDVAWVEWANPAADGLIRHLRSAGASVILRTHRYEINEPHYKDLPWNQVTRAVFVGRHSMEAAGEHIGGCIARSVVLPNAVDTGLFAYRPHVPGKRIGVAATIRGVKQPGMWVSLMRQLPPEFEMRICGEIHDLDFAKYVFQTARRCKLSIRHDGYIKPEDMPAWWAEQDWCLSTSAAESQGMNFLEAAACGVQPLVQWFPGCEAIVPAYWIWEEFSVATSILKWTHLEHYNSRGCRNFVESRYSFDALRPKYVKLIQETIS